MARLTYADVFERDYFSKGLAVCEPHILTDTIFFRFRDEEFEFPANDVWQLVKHDRSSFDSAEVEKLREYKRKKGNGHG